MLQRCGAALRLLLATAVFTGSVVATVPMDKAQAAAGDRALKLYNMHTKESATIVFKRGNRFDPDGLKQLNNFLRDWRRNEPTKMDPQLFDLIWTVYQQSGSRQPIHVVSGYRSPATNGMLRSRSRGVAQKSQHMLGKAMDFFLPDVDLAKLRAIGLRMQVGGVGFYPTSGSPFVHMDTGSVRHWPKMTRDQLVRVFPDGKTLHIPSDGRPLPGYEQALASYKARKAGGGAVMMASAAPAKKGKSWFARLTGTDASDEDDMPDTPVEAATPTAKPDKVKPAVVDAVQVAAVTAEEPEQVPFATASAPLPRPSPKRGAEPAADASVVVAAADTEAGLPPAPRRSPVVRPMMALASVAPIPQPAPQPTPNYGTGITDTLAAIEESSAGATQTAALPRKPGTAADAIADAIGQGKPASDAIMAYAAPLTVDESGTHIDAATGAIVSGEANGRPAAKTQAPRVASLGGDIGIAGASPAASPGRVAADPLARLTPVAYQATTIELVTRSGSTRQKAYADLQMPHPFAVPELFTAPERSIRLGFGRIAYEGLRTDRFAGPLVHRLGTMEFASLEPISRTALLKR
ncbi:DUF882 domain-containing protein [Kaistia sp. 32K]|uniref:DUF882 domain-containing protein n=1 Tax=Kaistia sp. 32K TaxID=2795690 RepID=UPI001915636D|nr:DUF882 domain-containing protein [Kaistia sp. 32K]